jgi:hypothetical protein
MKGSLLDTFYEGRTKPDQRFLDILIRSSNDANDSLVRELEKMNRYLEKDDRKRALELLEQLKLTLSGNANPAARISGRFIDKNRLTGRLMHVPGTSVLVAVERLLDEFVSGEAESDDLPLLECLLFCFRRSDVDNAGIRSRLLHLLHHPADVKIRHSDIRITFFTLLIRAYFGERESGSYLSGIFPGLSEADNWIDDLLHTFKMMFVDEATHPCFPPLHQVIIKLCRHRLKEAISGPVPHGAFFKKHPGEVERLQQVFQTLTSE